MRAKDGQGDAARAAREKRSEERPGRDDSQEPGTGSEDEDLDDALDEASEESFPASDPPAVSGRRAQRRGIS